MLYMVIYSGTVQHQVLALFSTGPSSPHESEHWRCKVKDGTALVFPIQEESANPESQRSLKGTKESLLYLVANGAWHEELLVGEMAHPCHVNLIRVVQAFSHTAQVVQCHACVEPLRISSVNLYVFQDTAGRWRGCCTGSRTWYLPGLPTGVPLFASMKFLAM